MKMPSLSSLKSLKGMDVAAKAAGAIGLAAVTYDAHHWGKLKAYDRKNTKGADAATDYFNNTQYLDDQSHITSKMKKGLLNMELTNPVRGPWNSMVGYVGGFVSNAARNIVPLGASIGALALKGTGAKVSLGVLGASALWSGFTNVGSHLGHKE